MNGNSIIESIKVNQHPRFDTLYCTSDQKDALVASIASGQSTSYRYGDLGISTDRLRVFGLEVKVIESLNRPIMCEKGDVFPLAKDYE